MENLEDHSSAAKEKPYNRVEDPKRFWDGEKWDLDGLVQAADKIATEHGFQSREKVYKDGTKLQTTWHVDTAGHISFKLISEETEFAESFNSVEEMNEAFDTRF